MGNGERFFRLFKSRGVLMTGAGMLLGLGYGNLRYGDQEIWSHAFHAGEGAVAGFLLFLLGYANLLEKMKRAGIGND